MHAIIILILFVGMFLVVQSVYEDKIKTLESQLQPRLKRQDEPIAAKPEPKLDEMTNAAEIGFAAPFETPFESQFEEFKSAKTL